MEPAHISKPVPLMFLLEIDPALIPIGGPWNALSEAVHGTLVRELGELMETLGIPGEPAVEIKSLQGPPLETGFMRFSVGGQVLHYPDETLRSVYCWLTGSPIRADITSAGMLSEMMAWLSKASDPHSSALLFSQMSLAVIKLQPYVLLGQSQVAAYVASLPVPEMKDATRWPPDQDWLTGVLRQVLRLRISIADKQAVATALAPCMEGQFLNACETLIDVLRPDAVEIYVEKEYLRQLTTRNAENRSGRLTSLRDGLFAELGIVYPAFRLVPDTQLAPRQFMFKLNYVTCVPQVGLGPEESLVNDTPERLRALNITAVAAGNPATGRPNSITNLEHQSALETGGCTTWDQMDYLILSLAAVLRSNAGCFVSRRFTEEQLQQVETAFPALVNRARSVVSVEETTAVLRKLAAEETSVRNLRLILERLSDYQFWSDAGWPVVLDDAGAVFEVRAAVPEDHLSQLTRFVRAGMKRQISRKLSRQTTLVIYLMDHTIEELWSSRTLAEQDEMSTLRLGEDQQGKILEAVRKEIGYLPPSAQVPCILTTSEVREHLRETIALEFPRLSVIAYDEVLPDVNIQPIARISWSAPANP